MNIEELQGKKINISAHSITVKNDEDKTAGIVRNIIKFKDLRPNIQCDYSKILRNTGLWNSKQHVMDQVIYCNNKLCYINNLKRLEDIERYFLNKDGWESETASYYELKELAQKAEESGITVIDCYII